MKNNYKKGLISICCLGFNHGQFITSCLESIWMQNYNNIEIIALDDGSSDNSATILQEQQQKSPMEMKLILQENCGNIGKNLNKMIRLAAGEFISFISLDDTLQADAFSSKIKHFNNDKNMIFVGNKLLNRIDEKTILLRKNINQLGKRNNTMPENSNDLIQLEFERIGAFLIQGVLFKKSIIDAIKGFDEDLIGDDIVLRTKIFLHMKNNPHMTFTILNKTALNYRIHGNNLHKNYFRQVLLIKEWKDRYFPDKTVSKKIITWTINALNNSFDYYKIKEYVKILLILEEFLKPMSENKKNMIFKKINANSNNRFLIPYIFEINHKKDITQKEISLKVMGIKIIEYINSKFDKRIKILSLSAYVSRKK